ncbi:dioxygenase [Pseudomonas amygdali]|uniref:dioxygenase n=1 Tax=Pseudomonas amygdali TaxID=47877 RepID=UPI0005CA341F|nr:dioxygenase [Pseudomonas amygdali]PHN40478.1 6-chlorohydroxyquinol-1,2-dioxygenase [Pseudomonas amygdali]
MRNLDETTITQAVLATRRSASDARLSEVMTCLVQHLHGFARDIKLTEQEWQRGIDFLEQVGQAGSPNHREYALLSHILGLPAMVLAQNRKRSPVCTEPAVSEERSDGQAHVHDLGVDLHVAYTGANGWVQGTVRDTKAMVIPYATLQVLPSRTHCTRPALLQADANGQFCFCTVLPQSHQVAQQGPVNILLTALDRPAWRPAYLEFVINATGFRELTTLIFCEGDPHLATDALFGVRASLIAQWQLQPPGCLPDGMLGAEPFHILNFDFVLAPA